MANLPNRSFVPIEVLTDQRLKEMSAGELLPIMEGVERILREMSEQILAIRAYGERVQTRFTSINADWKTILEDEKIIDKSIKRGERNHGRGDVERDYNRRNYQWIGPEAQIRKAKISICKTIQHMLVEEPPPKPEVARERAAQNAIKKLTRGMTTKGDLPSVLVAYLDDHIVEYASSIKKLGP